MNISQCPDVFDQQIKRLEELQKEWQQRVYTRKRDGHSPASIRDALSQVFKHQDQIEQLKQITKHHENTLEKNA